MIATSPATEITMTQAHIALLLSAFICPGSGHFYLKRHNTGTVLSAISLAALVYLLQLAIIRAREISDKLLSGEIPLDLPLIHSLITAPDPVHELWISLATLTFGLAWLFGVIDAYRLGRLADRGQEPGPGT